jgi:hypothetical protein
MTIKVCDENYINLVSRDYTELVELDEVTDLITNFFAAAKAKAVEKLDQELKKVN